MRQSYEHPHGHKLLQDVECVVNFVEMKRCGDDIRIAIHSLMPGPLHPLQHGLSLDEICLGEHVSTKGDI